MCCRTGQKIKLFGRITNEQPTEKWILKFPANDIFNWLKLKVGDGMRWDAMRWWWYHNKGHLQHTATTQCGWMNWWVASLTGSRKLINLLVQKWIPESVVVVVRGHWSIIFPVTLPPHCWLTHPYETDSDFAWAISLCLSLLFKQNDANNSQMWSHSRSFLPPEPHQLDIMCMWEVWCGWAEETVKWIFD